MLIQGLLILGLVLALLVVVQISLIAAGSLVRLAGEVKRRGLEWQILNEKLEAARVQHKKKEESVLPWNGNRKFRIERKVCECPDICSFYLRSHDNKPLPEFLPGQYLTFELDVPGRQKHLIRCYSLSDRPHKDHYRVTIKRIKAPPDDAAAPPGVGSNFFHDQLKEGDIVDVRAPSGGFYLDTSRELPVALVAGGVGITPLLSMLNEIVETGSKRETWFFLCVGNGSEHPFKEQLARAAREHENIRLHICYSRPRPEDVLGRDYQHAGRVSIDLLKKLLPSNNYGFYVCGPGAMMEAITTGLKEWGVPEKKIQTEAFGPASVKKIACAAEAQPPGLELAVHFSKSGRKLAWKGQVESILDLATAANIAIDSGCRAGNCGTCKVAVKSGKVKYLKEPGYDVEAGTCLTCCCVPETEVVLDA
jgi:hypothetical protein